jgi:hypothetical protein
MMKKLGMILLVGCLAAGVFAGEEFEGEANINSVQKKKGEKKSGEDIVYLEAKTSHSGEKFEGVMYAHVMLEDKNGVVYYAPGKAKGPSATKLNRKGDEPTGGVTWTFEITITEEMKRPKIAAYALEYFYEAKDAEPILLASDYYKCKSAEELKKACKGAEKIKFSKKRGKPDYPKDD